MMTAYEAGGGQIGGCGADAPLDRSAPKARSAMTLRRICVTLAAMLSAVCGPALADPALRVEFHPTGVRLELDGSFAGSTYTVLRADSPAGTFQAITSADVLCLGECFAWDAEAVPGRTQFYRFDLLPPGGQPMSFGPYAVTIPRAT